MWLMLLLIMYCVKTRMAIKKYFKLVISDSNTRFANRIYIILCKYMHALKNNIPIVVIDKKARFINRHQFQWPSIRTRESICGTFVFSCGLNEILSP